MVAQNPLLTGGSKRWSLVKKFNATVINDIWPETMFFTLVATMVALVSKKTDHSLAISNQMLTVLGTVLGLVVSFRTSSAYDRYWEGRRLWTTINLISRNLAHLIWIHVPTDREDKTAPKLENGSYPKVPVIKTIIEKKSMVTLVQAFSVAVKHALRGEPGIYYKDLYPLVSFLPRYANADDHHNSELLPMWESYDGTRPPAHPNHPTRIVSSPGTSVNLKTLDDGYFSEKAASLDGSSRSRHKRKSKSFNPEAVLPEVPSHVPLRPARNPPRAQVYDYLPILLVFKPFISMVRHLGSALRLRATRGGRDDRERNGLGRKVRPPFVESSVPLEITLFLSSYLQFLLKNSLLQPAIATAFTNGIVSFQDTMANLDRIRTTPIPFAYQAHLRMSMWLYLFFLPFQIFTAFGYLTIPATAFASFLLLGFLEIGQEIENPFNYDLNDLDLDDFCLTIQRELHEVTAHPVMEPQEYVFGAWNQPFAPSDRRSAPEIIESVTRSAHHAQPKHESDANDDGHHHHPHPDRERTLTSEFGVFDAGKGPMGSVREMLLKNWRQVSDSTIEKSKSQYEDAEAAAAAADVEAQK